MGDGPVNSGALAARNCSVVDDGDAAPATVVAGGDAGLAVGVLHARVVDGLAFLHEGDLVGDEFENLLGVPFADGSVQTFHHDEDVSARHGAIQTIGGRSSELSETDGHGQNFGGADGGKDALDGSLSGLRDPNLAFEGLHGALGPDGAVRSVDGGGSGGEGGVPFAFHVILGNLQATVISDEDGGGVVVRNAVLLARGLGGTTVGRFHTSGVRRANI